MVRKLCITAATLAALLLAPRPAAAEPSNGLPALIGGGILIGGGVINLAGAPLCLTAGNLNHPGLCAGLSIGVGIGMLVPGVVLMIVGATQRSAYFAWERTRVLPSVTAQPGGASLTWGWTW